MRRVLASCGLVFVAACSSSSSTSSEPSDPALQDASVAEATADTAVNPQADAPSEGAPPDVKSDAAVPPAKGFIDLHIHQMAEYAYAGAWIWGSHKGVESDALAACNGGSLLGSDHARTKLGPLNEFLGQTTGTQGDTGLHENKKQGYPAYDGWPRWDTIAHQQTWEGHLEQAHAGGMNLMIMSAVNFRPLCEAMPEANRKPGLSCNDMESIDYQLDRAWEFDKARDWVEIALTPYDARRIIAEGKLAMILAVEISELFPTGDWLPQLQAYHARGVRSIQLAHQLNNRFTGVAPHHWIFKVFQYLEEDTGFQLDAEGHNLMGLTDDGRALAAAMMDLGMITDISHVSERGVHDLHAVATGRGYYPLVLSHGHFRSIMLDEKQDEEKTTPDDIVRIIRETGGMFGLRTGAEQVKTWTKSGVPNDCDGSTKSLAQAYSYGAFGLKVDVALASDFNGFIAQLRPRFGGEDETCGASGDSPRVAAQQAAQKGPSGTALDANGFGHIGLEPAVIKELKSFGVDTTKLESSAETFLRLWDRCLDPKRTGPLPTSDMDPSGIQP